MIARVFKSFLFSFIFFLFNFVNPAPDNSAQDLLKELTYKDSQRLSFPVPGTDQRVTFSWNFPGSGNIFLPLPSVSAQLTAKTHATTPTQASENLLAELGKALLKNELYKKGKNNLLIKWFTQSKLSPMHLFVVKVFLLLKDSHPTNDASFVRSELCRLLFRLSLVEEIQLLDQKRSFTSYLPEAITDILESFAPDTVPYLNNVWNIIRTSSNKLDNQDSYLAPVCQINGFAFSSKKKAEQCYTELKKTNFQEDPRKIILKNGLEITPSFQDFTKVQSISNNNLVSFLVGHTTGLLNGENKAFSLLIPTLSAELAKTKQPASLGTLLIEGQNGQWWIVQLSEQFELRETIELMILTLVRAFKDVFQKQQDYFLAHPQDAQKYHHAQELSQLEQEKRTLFLNSPEGIASTKRLAHNSALLEQKYAAQDSAEQLKELEKAIAQTTKAIKAPGTNNNKTEKEAELQRLNEKKKQLLNNPVMLLTEKKQELEPLILLIAHKQLRNEKSEQEIKALRQLQAEISTLEKNRHSSHNLQAKNAKRTERVKMYQKEAKLLADEWKKRYKYIPTPDRALAFFASQEGLKLQSDYLNAKAEEILAEHDTTDFIQQLIAKNPELSNVNVNEVKEKLTATLTYIIQHSTHIKENQVVYQALIKSFFPELLPWFENLTITGLFE